MSHPMANASAHASDVAFTPAVKAIQARKGSRKAYAAMEQGGGWKTVVTADLRRFIADATSFYVATASAGGQPYIQHRGGPPGFLRVVDESTLAFVDYAGNRQYISAGNLSENPKAQLFLMDYEHKQRIKIWATAEVVEGDAALVAKLMPADYRAKPEQVIVLTVVAWDSNCPQHIPLRLDADKLTTALDLRDRRIKELEGELARVQSAQLKTGGISATREF